MFGVSVHISEYYEGIAYIRVPRFSNLSEAAINMQIWFILVEFVFEMLQIGGPISC